MRLSNPTTDAPCGLCLGRPYTADMAVCRGCRVEIEGEYGDPDDGDWLDEDHHAAREAETRLAGA